MLSMDEAQWISGLNSYQLTLLPYHFEEKSNKKQYKWSDVRFAMLCQANLCAAEDKQRLMAAADALDINYTLDSSEAELRSQLFRAVGGEVMHAFGSAHDSDSDSDCETAVEAMSDAMDDETM